MKIPRILSILMAGAMAISAMAQADHPQPPGTGGLTATESPDDPTLTPNSVLGPRETLNAYEQEMAMVTVQTYQELSQIAQAFHAGQISSDEAEHLSRRCFELSMIRLQFLDTLHQIVESTLSKEAPPAQPGVQLSRVTTSEETLVVVPPDSSPGISESVAKYLELTPPQIAAIQARISQEQKQVRPLLQHLSENRKALTAVTENQSSNREIRKLAAEQSRIMEQIIIANSRLQRDIYQILTVAQRQKLNDMPQNAADVTKNPFAQR